MKRELTQAEIQELFREIIEDSKKYPPKVTRAKCNDCKWRVPMEAKCKLYPNVIPKAILINKQTCEAFTQK